MASIMRSSQSPSLDVSSDLEITQTESKACSVRGSSTVLDGFQDLSLSPTPQIQSTESFPILNLPAELRMLIYSYICGFLTLDVGARNYWRGRSRGLSYWAVTSTASSTTSKDNHNKYCYLSNLPFGALLQTNHQVRREAAHLLYLQSSFRFPTHGLLRRFLKKVNRHHLKQIRGLEVDYDLPLHAGFSAAKGAKGVKKRWASTCTSLMVKLPNISSLSLNFYVFWKGHFEILLSQNAFGALLSLSKLRYLNDLRVGMHCWGHMLVFEKPLGRTLERSILGREEGEEEEPFFAWPPDVSLNRWRFISVNRPAARWSGGVGRKRKWD